VLTALRDDRLMFCGYDPRGFKLFVWVLSAVLCGLAGALYVPQWGHPPPDQLHRSGGVGGPRRTRHADRTAGVVNNDEELVHRGSPNTGCSSSARCSSS
jgi:hypothetical protein